MRADKVLKLRALLDKLGTIQGMMGEEKGKEFGKIEFKLHKLAGLLLLLVLFQLGLGDSPKFVSYWVLVFNLGI